MEDKILLLVSLDKGNQISMKHPKTVIRLACNCSQRFDVDVISASKERKTTPVASLTATNMNRELLEIQTSSPVRQRLRAVRKIGFSRNTRLCLARIHACSLLLVEGLILC